MRNPQGSRNAVNFILLDGLGGCDSPRVKTRLCPTFARPATSLLALVDDPVQSQGQSTPCQALDSMHLEHLLDPP